MHPPATRRELPGNPAFKWLIPAAIAMSLIAVMAITAVVQAQSSNAPNPPTGLMAETVTANSIRVAWQPPAPNNCQVSRYNVLAEAQLANNYAVDVHVPGQQLRYTLDNLDPKTPHDIRVYAHSDDPGCDLGSTPAILEVSTTDGPLPTAGRTPAPWQPAAPKPVNALSQPQNVRYEIAHNALTVTWDHSAASGGCQLVEYVAILVEWDGNPNTPIYPNKYRERKIAANESPSATFSGLPPQTGHYTYLAARGNASCDGHGYSPKVEHYFTTRPVPPTPTPTPTPTPIPTPINLIEWSERYEDLERPAVGGIFVEVVKDKTVYGNSDGLQSTFNVTEGDSGTTDVPVQIRLTGSPSAEVKVRLMFQKPNDSSAQGRRKAGANRDFHRIHQTLTWAANAQGDALTKTINLKIIGDTRAEGDETVRLAVQEIRGTPLSADEQVKISRNGKKHFIKVVIKDDDAG